MTETPLLDVRGLSTDYTARRGGKTVRIQAVKDVSFTLAKREVLGIVGESGCGKTSVGRSIVRLAKPHRGEVLFAGKDIFTAGSEDLRKLRLKIRMVFQDPFASLNPRRAIGDSIAETGDIHGLFANKAERQRRIHEALTNVGLDASFAARFPHELSGGQRQRVGIARAILPAPDVVIADEPVSALDVSVQAQVLNLLADLQAEFGVTYLFISHDLAVIDHVCDEVAVMQKGLIVEFGDTEQVLQRPAHEYTRALLAAVPRATPPSARVDPEPSSV